MVSTLLSEGTLHSCLLCCFLTQRLQPVWASLSRQPPSDEEGAGCSFGPLEAHPTTSCCPRLAVGAGPLLAPVQPGHQTLKCCQGTLISQGLVLVIGLSCV